MSADLDALHLLLARAGDRAPALPDGLALTPALAPEPTREDPSSGDIPDEPEDARAPAADVWGVIAPEGPEGDRLLEIMAPLIKAREAAMGRAARTYRVPKPSGPMTIGDAIAWRNARYDDGSTLGDNRSGSQLILGDLDQVPLAIQEAQSIDAAVGRICFPDDAGYAAYAAKVLAAEATAPRKPGRLVMHTAHDGSRALAVGLEGLSRPGEALLRAEIESGDLAVTEILSHATPDFPGKSLLLDRAAAPDPGVLFTLSHGLGMPMGGWASPEAQRKGQGAMAFGVTDQLDAEEIASRRFMPNGLWMMFACFSAGTPDESVYEPWLAQVLKQGQRPPDLRRTLAKGAPFIARLPQRALANPDGPLGFIGHVDLAWTHSFRDDGDPQRSHAGRFMRVLAGALNGATLGSALRQLGDFVVEADRELAGAYADAARSPAGADADAIKRALIWMRRQDLAGFILLGDPWARLPIAPRPARLAESMPFRARVAPPPIPVETLEKAVAHIIIGVRPAAEVAAEAGIELGALVEYVAAYVAAGRQAIMG